MSDPKQAGVGAVTASSAEAAEAGETILCAGGNAVDAAVATALASCVTDPCNTGLGGYGGHMVIAQDGPPICVDFNAWTPAGTEASAPRAGIGASTAPSVVAGLSVALDRFGSMDWAQVSAPAIALAERGVKTNAATSRAFDQAKGAAVLAECFVFDETAAGVTFRQPLLAKTLRTLADQGAGWFYHGPNAELGSRLLSDNGRPVTPDQWRNAVDAVGVASAPSLRVGDTVLYSAPLRTSGSPCMFATAAAGAGIAECQKLGSPAAVAEWARTMASIWSYRFGTETGNAFENIALEQWVAVAIGFHEPASPRLGTGHTCHLNAADSRGGRVALTLTHGPRWFGARWALPDTGIVMNLGGAMFGIPGPVDGEGRRYGVTNMSPTLAMSDNGAQIAIGCPGGKRIPGIVATALVRHLFAGFGLQEAISLGRFHAEDLSRTTLETGRWDQATRDALGDVFAAVGDEKPEEYYGPLTAIAYDPDGAVSLGLDDRWQGYGTIVR